MIMERLLERRAVDNSLGTGTLTDKGWIASLLTASGGTSSSGLPVTEWTAEGIPAMWACQRAISETVGQIPLKLIKDTGAGRTPAIDEDLYWVLHDLANMEMTAYTFKELLTRHLVGWGNAYAEIERDAAGRVIALWPLQPWRMLVDRNEDGVKRWTYSAPNGRQFAWINSKVRPPILHLHVNSTDGFAGRSPVRVLMDSIGLTQAVNQFGADWFKNYSAPATALTHPHKLTPEGREHLRIEWNKLRGEWGAKHRLAILQEGMTVARLSCAPDEAQFIETRSFQVEEMARIYRVPLVVIQHMTKSTSWGSGIEQMLLSWLATGLDPYLVQWQQAIARDCLTQRTFMTHKAVWVTASLLRTDLKTRSEALAIQKANGVVTPNEWRALEDMNPRTDPFGDEYDVAIANTTPASLAVKKAAEPVSAANGGGNGATEQPA